MKDCIKSKFSKDTLYWNIPFVIFLLIISILATIILTRKFFLNNMSLLYLFGGILLYNGSLILSISVMKMRYYLISREHLKYYSFFHPFGKTLYFSSYTGKIITTETSPVVSYKVVYLVDRNNRTAFKIMGSHYKNMDEIIEAIPLKRIDFSLSAGSYFKLLFTGKIKVDKENKNDRRKNKNAEQKIRRIIYIVVSIGLLCFVLGMIVKILSKL